MFLPMVLLPLAALLQQSLGQENPGQTDGLSDKAKKEIVDKHNTIRRDVQPTASNMVKMKWSNEAAKTAKKWAVKCASASSSKKERFVNGQVCGESTVRSNYPSTWSDTIDLMASTKAYFVYNNGATDPTKNIFSYTQIIWHHSNQVGCAVAYCPNNEYNFIYVCHYCPTGNIIGQDTTPYKQGPPCGDCPDACEDKLCINSCNYVDKEENCKVMLESFTCNESFVQERCAASCNCPAF